MRTKRAISLILAVCMLISLLPSIALANTAEPAGISITYDVQSRWGEWKSNSVKFAEFTYESNKGLWEYYGNTKDLDSIDSSTTLNWNGAGSQMQMNSGWWAVKIVVPKSGVYTPSVPYTQYRYGAILGVYLIDASTGELDTADISEENRLGQKSCYVKDLNPAVADIATFEDRYIEAGEYYLVYNFDGKDEYKNTSWVYIGNLTLDGAGSGTVLSGITTESNTTVIKGKTAQFESSLWLNDKSAATGTYELSYESTDKSIATVDADGVITGVAPGKAVITVSVKNEAGLTLTAKKTVTVVTDEIKVLYDVRRHTVEQGMTWNSAKPLSTLSYTATNDFYGYHSASEGADGTNSGIINYNGGFQIKYGSWVALEIYVPRAGTYNFEMYSVENKSTSYNINTNVYISASGMSESSDDYVGYYCMYNSMPSSEPVTKPVGSYTFPSPGKYVVTFKPDTGKYGFGYVHSFALVGGENSSLISGKITADADSVEVYQPSFKVTATGYLSATAKAATFTYSSSDERIARVDAETGVITAISPGEVTITATANAKYDNELKKKITVDPSTNPIYQKSNVKVTYDIASVTAEESRSKTTPFTYMTYAKSNGFWRYLSNSRNWTVTEDWSICMIPSGMQLGNGRWFAFEIYVPAIGTYSLSVQHGEFARSENTEVYVSASDAEKSVVDSSYLVGSFKTYNEDYPSGFSDLKEEPTYVGELVVPEAGYYRVAFKAVSGDYGTAGNIILDGTVEGEAEKTALMRPVITSEKEKLTVGDTEQLNTVVYKSDGTVSDSVTVAYSAETPSLATVDSASGLVTALAAGKAVFKALATDGVSTTESDYQLKIEPENASGYIVTYDIASVSDIASATYDTTNDFWSYNPQEGSFTALNIKVPVSGNYLASLKGTGELYILPAGSDIAAALDTAEPANVVNLTAGEYIAVVKGEDADVDSIVLDGGDELALMKVSIAIENSKATVSGILSDGSATDLADATVVYSSKDKAIATINADGIISENAIGKTIITADVTLGPVNKAEEYEYEVSVPPMEYSGVDTVYDFLSINGWNEEMTVNAGFTIPEDASGAYYDVRGITYEYTGVGKEPGNWEYRGVGDATKWGNFTPVFGEFHAYYTGDKTADGSNLKCRLRGANQYMAINIKIPAAGRYSPTLEYSAYYSGEAKLDLYIIPGDTENDDIYATLTDEYYFGTVDFLDESLTAMQKQTVTLNNIEITPEQMAAADGEFILVFKQPSKTTGTYFRLKKLFLNGVNCLRKADLEISDTDLLYGETATASVTPYLLDGTELAEGAYTVEYDSSYPDVVSVDKNGVITAIGDGESTITVTVSDGLNTITVSETVKATDNTAVLGTTANIHPNIYVRGAEKLDWRVNMESGNQIKIPAETISYTYSASGIAEADENGKIFGVAPGEVTITLSADFRGTQVTEDIVITVLDHGGKTQRNYYTPEKVANAQENISKYSWAKSTQKSAVAAADKWVSSYEIIYDNIPGEGIPRASYVGYFNDPYYKNCKWCGTDVVAEYGGSSGGWIINIINEPWKIQCPKCKRKFPSNDFELLYERGLDKQGYYDRDRAIAANIEAVANGEKDALVNELYPELEATVNHGEGLRAGETVQGWGVDDGWGYVPLDENGENFVYANGVKECHAYIPNYVHEVYGDYGTILTNLSEAYVYTGDIKYGRAGAIILDRIADLYPSFDNNQYSKLYPLSDGGSGRGHILGRIADPSLAVKIATAADAFFPATDDAQVISFLEEKAEYYGLENKKQSGLDIWNNWDTNILSHIFTLVKDGRINGNYGLYHHALSSAAIAKSTEPETGEMLAWLYEKDDESTTNWLEGGDFTSKFVDVVDRNGMGNEASAAYNGMWLGRLHGMADMLSHYKGEKSYNPYDNPKFVNMFMSFIPIITVNSHTANMGDNNGTAEDSLNINAPAFIDTFKNVTDPKLKKKIAEALYIYYDYDVSDINYGIFEKDPERLGDEIEALVGGKPPVFDSEMLTGYGFAILRDGEDYISASEANANNNMRDFWVWFGRNAGHGHKDVLEIGIEAYGLNLAPDLGYPEITGTDAMRLQWVSQTIAHNTVSVNKKSQVDHGIHGYPHHFDDSGKVKVIDISAPNVYEEVDEYRRTVVMVEVNDDISYGVDFFRILGGDAHTYSFHSQAENAYVVEGLEMEEQKGIDGNWKGSYADENWDVGEDPNSPEAWTYETEYPRGYSWLGKVRRDKTPAEKFAVEFDVEDYRKLVKDGSDIVLRVTQMNDFAADEVAITSGPVPNRSNNKPIPSTFDYMLVQREGENLDSMFTTVYEPYRGERYLKDMNAVEVTVSEDSEAQPGKNDTVRAVKVEHTDGRVDYIVHATNTSVTYNVDGEFDFRGAIGVYSKNAAKEVIYRYVNDGDIIGDETEAPARLTGTVDDFERELAFGNYIDVNLTGVEAEDLAGKYIYVDNDEVENGVYPIESAEDIGDGKIRLHTGLVTMIRAHREPADPEKGYIYNIKPEQSFVIPMAFVDENLPEFEPVSDNLSTTAGSSITVDVNATSPLENRTITYIGTSLPRGASLDKDTGILTWRPTDSQTGINHVAVTAQDSDGRESTIHFDITVYGSTSGGGGGGGGDTTTTPVVPDDKEDEKPDETTPDETTKPDEGTTGETEEVRFIDLGNHAWAKDAINSLADEGVIKGTTHNTYSPANNITRADYAVLLVRAFEQTSDNTENFDDVLDTDYFASEIAIARNTGIVEGIGENKFAPRNNITRQDMMVMTYRALVKLGIELETGEVTAPDMDEVSDYAKEAVTALMSSGLINGKDGYIDPKTNTTRAEVAVLLRRILDYVK